MTVSPQNELSYLGVVAQNPPTFITFNRAPNTGDYQFKVGTLAIDTVGLASYQLVTVLGTVGTWVALGGGAAALATINNQAPIAGNYTLAGTAAQITATNTAGTTTFSIPAVFTAPGSIASTTSITAGTSLTATLGNITATNGNHVFGTAGNKIVSTSVGTVAAAGANSFGSAVLVGGTVTIATTAVTANSIIMLTRQSVGATGANPLGMLGVGTIVGGTSFVINSNTTANSGTLVATDVSVVGYMIIN